MVGPKLLLNQAPQSLATPLGEGRETRDEIYDALQHGSTTAPLRGFR